MNIDLKRISIGDLFAGYDNRGNDGVTAYGGRLDVRPQYQREFIYKSEQQEAVIDTVCKGFPLNVMYWAVDAAGDYEIIDGQQRTISICNYVNGDFSCTGLFGVGAPRAFHSLSPEEQTRVRDYQLMVYLCSGGEDEKLEWFKTINIAGEELSPQELRNAVYRGPWVTAAKKVFSRIGEGAHGLGNRFISKRVERQEYLETAIRWVIAASPDKISVEEYMGRHQMDATAQPMYDHFQAVIAWVKRTFPVYRGTVMKQVDWGALYAEHGRRTDLDADALEAEILPLMQDDEIKAKKGIYVYVLTGEERHLHLRTFTDAQKRSAFARRRGDDGKAECPGCNERFSFEEMEADHIDPWHEGGKTEPGNCQMLCRPCNRRKGGR